MSLYGAMIFAIFGILLIIHTTDATDPQTKRYSRITSSRSFGTNVKQSSSNGVNFDCPEEFGYYPHPTDCTQYYVCVFGGALLESCTGGLMYSHELQTCDWPRNVGCEITDNEQSKSVSSDTSSGTFRLPQVSQQISHRVRFGSSFTTSTLPPQTATIPQQYHRQPPQAIQTQIQTLPPPPELRVAPNPVITSRGQPKHLLDSQENIAKLYADAHDTLPPVEEEENDRQQRVYRGQPSTVGQVQRDRDGIIHQASINSIPNHGKVGSYAFGSHLSQYRTKLNKADFDYISIFKNKTTGHDDDLIVNYRRRIKRNANDGDIFLNKSSDAVSATEFNFKQKPLLFQSTNSNVSIDSGTEFNVNNSAAMIEHRKDVEMDKINVETVDSISINSNESLDENFETGKTARLPRQLRPLSGIDNRPRWFVSSSNYRAIDNTYPQRSFSYGSFNPYLLPPVGPNYNNLVSGYQSFLPQQSNYNNPIKPAKVKYTGYNLSLPPHPEVGDSFQPLAANQYTSPSIRPHLFKQSDILPFLLKSLEDIKDKRKKLQSENFSYFHLGNEPLREIEEVTETPSEEPLQFIHSNVSPKSPYSPFSTMGGFYNNQENSVLNTAKGFPSSVEFKSTPGYDNKNLLSQLNVSRSKHANATRSTTTTESNYFKYNILQNQKMKNYFTTKNPIPLWSPPNTNAFDLTTTETTASSPLSSFILSSIPNRYSFKLSTQRLPNTNSQNVSFESGFTASNFTLQPVRNLTTNIPSTIPSNTQLTVTTIPKSFPSPISQSFLYVKEGIKQRWPMVNLNDANQTSDLKEFKYLRAQSGGSSKIRGRKPSSISTSNVDYYYDEEDSTTMDYRVKIKKPLKNSKIFKGYESFIKSIPKHREKSTSSASPISNGEDALYYDDNKDDDSREGNDNDFDYDIHPPSQMPPYMPNSETMAPKPQLVNSATVNPKFNRPTFLTGLLNVTTTRRPFVSANFPNYQRPHSDVIPSFIHFPSDIFQDLKQRLPIEASVNNYNTRHAFTPLLAVKPTTASMPKSTTTTTITTRPNFAVTTRKMYTVRPNYNRGHNKWKQNKTNNVNGDAKKTTDNYRKRPSSIHQQQMENYVDVDSYSRVETNSAIIPATSAFAQPSQPPQQPQQTQKAQLHVVGESNNNNHNSNTNNRIYYNLTSATDQAYEPNLPQLSQRQQQSLPSQPTLPPQSSYDSYYSIYDDDVDLYRDVEYNNQQHPRQQQQHQQQSQTYQPQQPLRSSNVGERAKIQQQPTYRPTEVLTTQSSPQDTPSRETYVTKPLSQKPHQQSLIYNSDYDEDLIAQIEQDNEYNQPTRAPVRQDRITIETINDRPIVVSSATLRTTASNSQTSNQRTFYAAISTREPAAVFPPASSELNEARVFEFHLPQSEQKNVSNADIEEYSIIVPTQGTKPKPKMSSTARTTTQFFETTTPTPKPRLKLHANISNLKIPSPRDQSEYAPLLRIQHKEMAKDERSKALQTRSQSRTQSQTVQTVISPNSTHNTTIIPSSTPPPTSSYISIIKNPDKLVTTIDADKVASVEIEDVENSDSTKMSLSTDETGSSTNKFPMLAARGFNTSPRTTITPTTADSLEHFNDVIERQKTRILSYIESDVVPQSFKAASSKEPSDSMPNSTVTTAISTTTMASLRMKQYDIVSIPTLKDHKNYKFSLSSGSNGFRLRAELPKEETIPIYERQTTTTSTTPAASEEYQFTETNFDLDITPTTYSPPVRSWRFGRTSLMPFSKQETNSISDNAENVSFAESEFSFISADKWKSSSSTTTERNVQSFTARASVFKDSLNKAYDATSSPNRFVSPYKSLETILQEKDLRLQLNSLRTTIKPRSVKTTASTNESYFVHSSQKPYRTYFLFSSNARNLSATNITHDYTPNLRSWTTPTTPANISWPETTEIRNSNLPLTSTTQTILIRTTPITKPPPTIQSILNRSLPPTTSLTTNSSSTLETTSMFSVTKKVQTPSTSTIIPTPSSSFSTSAFTVLTAAVGENEVSTVMPQITTLRLHEISQPTIGTKLRSSTNASEISRPRGRSRYTLSVSNVLDTDEPTTYSPKYRLANGSYGMSSTTTSYRQRKTQRARLAILSSSRQHLQHVYKPRDKFQSSKSQLEPTNNLYRSKSLKRQKSDLENESVIYERPRSEALIALLPWNNNQNNIEEKLTSTMRNVAGSSSEKEHIVEITDRPPLYYSNKYQQKTAESTLAESLQNAGYISSTGRSKYRAQTALEQLQQLIKQNNENVRENIRMPYDEINAAVEEIPSVSFASKSIASAPVRKTDSQTATESTNSKHADITVSSTIFSRSASTFVTTPHTSTYPTRTIQIFTAPTPTTTLSTIPSKSSIQPLRASRVNNAIKTSIAAAASSSSSARNKAASSAAAVKCSDSTANAKCNEIPSRTTSNTNRNRGGSHFGNQEREQPATVTNNRGTHPPRTRPTLKPPGSIVSKAQEFIDIYRNPPTRPDPLYPQPTPDKTAAKCRKDVCLLPDCYCGGKEIPADLPVESVPQTVLLTFDDSVNDLNKQLYSDLFEKGRVNPNGCPITATFYVSHEWTDYSQVQNLYSDGHEMASHTISHSFGEQFSQKKWTREVAGQREILAAYGGVKLSDVRGMRAPFLSVGGNKMYKMLYDSNFTYDSSMPVYENRPPSWPYTLDYKIFHDCMIPPCPTRSYPGVWQVPMVMWQDLNGGRCSMGDACSNPADAENVYKMIMKNFERHYTTNRAPFGLFYHAAWFTQPHHKEGFIKFLDAINSMPDVWIITNWQALQWVRDPTPISRINSFQPFQCDYSDRPKRCNNPKVCNLWHKSGVRYMKTCQPCPDIYPWTGKTGIRSSRIDNEIEEASPQ